MSASRAAWVLAAGALVLLPSAAAAPSAQVAFTTGETASNGDIVLVNADGTGLVNLTPGQATSFDDDRSPSWSPDGSRLAFVSHRDANNTQEIYIMNADGTGVRRLTTDSGDGRTFNVDPAWSPDGVRIAWRKFGQNSADEIWVMNADGSGQRRLTTDAGDKTGPLWSPDSTRLSYARRLAGLPQAFVVDVSGGAVRLLTPPGSSDSAPRWSPDGSRLALTRNDRLSIVNADGTGARQLTATVGIGPVWSPDGTRIAFTGQRNFPEFGSRFGPAVRTDVFVVGADGKDERRLTGALGPEFSGSASNGAPSWWPDGSRLFFSPGATTYVMNADGSCEGAFVTVPPRLLQPAWRPGALPNLPPIACADLRVSVDASTDAIGLRQTVVYHVTIENDGTLAATGLRVETNVSGPAVLSGSLQTCTRPAGLVCDLPTLPAGGTTSFEVYARSTRAGNVLATVLATADQPDSDSTSNSARIGTTVLPCTTVGTLGNDAIYGTPQRDVICARTGWDRINALGGNDSIDAGNGNDTVDAGKGRDTVLGQGGADVILLLDGERDTVDCGTETDVVLADRIDRVAKNCEVVIRR